MKKIDILHISDLHFEKKSQKDIEEITKKLIDDIKKVENEQNINIDLVCFTGDLIQSGDNAVEGEKQWNLAMEIFIKSILTALSLENERLFIVPGNHEVQISKVDNVIENGLFTDSIEDINAYMNKFNKMYCQRLEYFYNIIRKMHPDYMYGDLGYAANIEINNFSIGISCVDSAWRSSGKGKCERGKLYVGSKQMQDLFQYIKDSDLKICLMHHPCEWFIGGESLEIEKELNKYDLVLRGHVHDEDDYKVTRQEMSTIFSTAGKIYPLDFKFGKPINGFNGYSIIRLDMDRCKCEIYPRLYYANKTTKFDKNLDVSQDGKKVYSFGKNADKKEFEFYLIRGIEKYFANMSEKYELIRKLDSYSPNNVTQVLVEPVFADKSEYLKEDSKSHNVDMNWIYNSTDNIRIIGKKESGKTTVLQQIGLQYAKSYSDNNIIPIYIDLNYLPKGEDRIYKAIRHFICDNILDNVQIKMDYIKNLLDEGKAILLFDNYSHRENRQTIAIKEFIAQYSLNRVILTQLEEFFQSLDLKEKGELEIEFKNIYIQYFGKSQIRDFVTKWSKSKGEEIAIDNVVNQIDSYFNHINFAKTAFNLSVFMVLWDDSNEYIPINEGIIMRRYLEIILEKMSTREGYRNQYPFEIKQHFLSCLAYRMYCNNCFYMTQYDFNDLLQQYHNQKGYNIKDSKFDTIFLEKNILCYSGEYIVFSHYSFLEFFLAIYANDNNEFLKEITTKGNRIKCKNIICFYSGLNQNCVELLNDLSDSILEVVLENIDLVDKLNDLEIISEFMIDKEEFIKEMVETRFSQVELDKLSDEQHRQDEKNPIEISGDFSNDLSNDDAEDFVALLQMFGSIIKNAEIVDNKYKIENLEIYMYGMNMLYAIMLKLFESFNKDFRYEELSKEDKKMLNINSSEELESVKKESYDMAKILFPIAVQNVILENVGSPKLNSAINELLNKKNDKPFEKFMLVFLKCDLQIDTPKQILNKYLLYEATESILKIALTKLTFYYQMRFFGTNITIDNDIIEMILDINNKLNETKVKTKMRTTSRGKAINKSLIEKELKKQLKKQLDKDRIKLK